MKARGRGKTALALLVGAALIAAGGASARHVAAGNVNWAGWGNTPDMIRYSPLDQITPSNVGQLGRAFTVDLNRFIPGIKKGQQTYPIVDDGVMYVTSGDDQVFAVNATNGALLWHWQPDNLATFKNYGIVANRGVAVCDGRVYELALDMTIVELDQQTGNLIQRLPISKAVPGAIANYGYSETSAPVCYNHYLVVGAAGSDYGVRGFTMAYHTPGLRPAWANPFWIIPPAGTEWRSAARIVGGGTNWTPDTIDPTTNTLYLGSASPAPEYYPELRPGTDPRTTSIIALDLATGKMKWWHQLIGVNDWAYDASQPPIVYTAKVGGGTRRIVSIATMEGMWFAFDAKTGQPIWQRVKVIDNVEHPNLKPGVPVAIYPSSLGGLNYSPASFDPQTGYVYNAAAETGVAQQQQLPAQVKKQELLLGNPFLGLANGDFGTVLQNGWKDYGSLSAIDVSTGQRVCKTNTPQPERGGPTTTAGGVGFFGGGDGVFRAFDVKSCKILWTFQTGFQIADGPSVYQANGTEYIAIGVGGTVTSSGGGTQASQIQVFSLGGSSTQSPAPVLPAMLARHGAPSAPRLIGVSRAAAAPRVAAAPKAGVPATILGPSGLNVVAWDPDTSNTKDVQGHLLLGGKPVAGAVVQINGWLARPTDESGAFTYPVDNTVPSRHVVTVADASRATVGGKPLSKAQRAAVLRATGGISVGYQIADLNARLGSGGTVVVSGRLTYGKNQAPQPVGIYSYLLNGTITDSNGRPVQGAVVTTRTNDHKFWTYSSPSGANGHYSSFLVAADQEGDDPVPMTVGVAVGQTSYAEPIVDFINFAALKSATLNIQLPASPSTTLVKTALTPQAIPGAIYEGIVVGAVGNGHVIKPVSATWPTAAGRFQLVLPSSARGVTVKLYEEQRQFFSTSVAAPGGKVDLSVYPNAPATDAPQGVATLKLPS